MDSSRIGHKCTKCGLVWVADACFDITEFCDKSGALCPICDPGHHLARTKNGVTENPKMTIH